MTAPAEPREHELVSNPRRYRYYDLVMAGFVTVLLCSNLIGPAKASQVGPWQVGPLTVPAVTFREASRRSNFRPAPSFLREAPPSPFGATRGNS